MKKILRKIRDWWGLRLQVSIDTKSSYKKDNRSKFELRLSWILDYEQEGQVLLDYWIFSITIRDKKLRYLFLFDVPIVNEYGYKKVKNTKPHKLGWGKWNRNGKRITMIK